MNEMITEIAEQNITVNLEAIKARQKATWESGDFGEIAREIFPIAEEFMARVKLGAGQRVLDVACGTGNLAVIAARRGCATAGVDIASNLIAQARSRAAEEGLRIEYQEGDAEDLPYEEASFDGVVTMFGAMFAPRPEVAAAELLRVTKPGGLIAMANWTAEGFIGKMFGVFRRYVPPPAGLASPLAWGNESMVRRRFGNRVTELRLTRRMASMRFPFDPAGTVEFFREYYGPTRRAFEALGPLVQMALRRELEELQASYNSAANSQETVTAAEYLEVQARRAG